ncbi:unnamed protein product [Mytilus edulis]|nr:unnamed protein product [Mytilus edulis]
MSSNHKILTLQEVQADKTTAVSGSTTCEDHSDKFIEIYCVDHNKPCCTVCATVKHRKCEKVVVIEDAAAGVKESKQTMEFLELIMLWKMILDKSIEGTEKNVVNVENLDNNIFSEIESLKKDIIEHVNKMEKAAKDELTITKKEILIQLTDKLTEMSSLKSTIDNWHRILSTCVKDGSDIQCLIEINKLIPMKDKIEADIIKATSDIDEKSFSFERNRVVENFEEMVKSLGQIRIETKHETVQSKSLSSSINSVPNQKEPDFNETIQSGSQGSSSIDMVPNPNEPNFHTGKVKSLFTLDAGETRWSAVCGIFTEEFIFISNLYKKKLLKFNLNGVFHSDIQFHNGPYDIAKFRENELAVAFIDSQEIQLINIHTMTIGWKIVLTVPVGGLRYMNSNNQFVTACDKCIVWLNASNGQKIKETKTNGNTFYVCVYGSNRYVYADGPSSVVCTDGGTKQFTYKNPKLAGPRGIDMDFHGNLYICSNKSSNIHQISASGKLIRIIPCDDIGTVKPWGIRFKENSNKFLVTSLSSGRVVVAEII